MNQPHAVIIAVHYRPEISGGVPRILILEDFLVRAGFRVTIVTPQPIAAGCRGAEILHVPAAKYLGVGAGGQAGHRPDAKGGQSHFCGVLPQESGQSPPRGSLVAAGRRWVKRCLFIPDTFVYWAARAAREAIRRFADRPPDLVISSSPQESSHSVGWRLKRRFGCRWVADFRDGWTFEPHRPEAAILLRRAIERRLERAVVERADWITAGTLPIAEDFSARFPGRRDCICFLPTGFEPFTGQPQGDCPPSTPGRTLESGTGSVFGVTKNIADSQSAAAENGACPPHCGRFRLVYAGRFGLSQAVRTPNVFFAGLAMALEADAEFRRRFRLVVAGDLSAEERQRLGRIEGLDHELLGRTSSETALQIAAGATMLLLVTPPGLRSIATRKLFDYLAVRRPVFALAEGNEAARIVAETRSGLCVSPADPQAVAAGLLRAFSLWQAGRLDAEFPCSGNDLYLAEPHFRRVFGEIILPEILAGG